MPSLQLGSGTRTCWFWEAPRRHSRYSRNDLRKEEQPGQQNTCSAAQTLWGGRKMLPSGVRACRPGQGNCAASTGDFLCQMSSGPEVRAKVLTFGIFCLKLWSCSPHSQRLKSLFPMSPLENTQPPHQEGVPGWKGWLLQLELISALSTAASAMHGHALPCRTCILHSRSFQKCAVPGFLDIQSIPTSSDLLWPKQSGDTV